MARRTGHVWLMRALQALAIGALVALAVLSPRPEGVLAMYVLAVSSAGNETCADLAVLHGGDQAWLEARSDPNANETLTVAGFGTITITNTQNDKTFDWTSTFGIDAVFVKAGSAGSNLYVYAATMGDDESTGSTDLTSPGDSGNQIGHIAFCYDAGSPQTSPSLSPSASPSPSPSPSPSLAISAPPSQPTGSEAPTGSAGRTPPPTDTVARSAPTSHGRRVIILAMAGLLAGMVVLTASPRGSRRK